MSSRNAERRLTITAAPTTRPQFSDIIPQALVKSVIDLLPKFKANCLLYRMSTHGNSIKRFHTRCDNQKGSLLFLFKSSKGACWGAYTTAPWTSTETVHSDKGAFLFSIGQEKCLVFKPANPDYAVSHSKTCGPIFGSSMSLCNTHSKNPDVLILSLIHI